MALPMLNEIQRREPSTIVSWICGKTVAPLLKEVIHDVHLIEVDENQLLNGNLFRRLGSIATIWFRLFRQTYDLILIGHKDYRYRLLTLFCRARTKRSFDKDFSKRIPIPGRWHVNEYIRLYTGIDGPDAPVGVLPKPDLKLKDEFKAFFDFDRKLIALTPGGARNSLRYDPLRQWPVTSYVALADRLLRFGYQVIVTGSVSDQWVSDNFKGLEVINLIGKTDLIDLLALFQHCDIIVTHDSGPLHLAALSGTTTVALFGPTDPNEKAKYDNIQIIWGGEELPCRPCYDGKNYAQCSNNLCLASILEEEVLGYVQKLISQT